MEKKNRITNWQKFADEYIRCYTVRNTAKRRDFHALITFTIELRTGIFCSITSKAKPFSKNATTAKKSLLKTAFSKSYLSSCFAIRIV